jgi:DNA-binding LytR/AlgR family response regulator
MIRCIIIEDEPLAVDVLADYISQVPSLQLKATCSDALQAMEVLNREPIDLKGLEFLETLAHPPRVILTTAYHEYALKSYEHSVVDYLLKPIAFKRFLQAVNKVQTTPAAPRKDVISVYSDKKMLLIPVDEILYIESQKEYVKIQTKTSAHLSKYALSKLEGELSPEQFLRIHRSFIIALSKITAYNSQEVDVSGTSLPIGGNYKEAVSSALGGLFKQ